MSYFVGSTVSKTLQENCAREQVRHANSVPVPAELAGAAPAGVPAAAAAGRGGSGRDQAQPGRLLQRPRVRHDQDLAAALGAQVNFIL